MRLIDADALKENIIDLLEIEWGYEGIREDVSRIIDSMPTVEERPHGEWIQVTARDGEYYCYHKCTNCGQTIESGFDNPPLFNFCPNCGSDNRKHGEAK